MRPIVAVTPNPSIDKIGVVPAYRLGGIHRPQRQLALAGGKGLNVARTIRRLGGDVRACVLLAGHAGRWVLDELNREGIESEAVWSGGETRSCLSILDPEGQTITEYYEPGAVVDGPTWDRFEALVAGEMAQAGMAVLSGSLPPGAPVDAYARLALIGAERSARVLIDSHGQALRLALAARPHLVKINSAEAAEVLRRPVEDLAGAAEAAADLQAGGAAQVVITLGEGGAVAVNDRGGWRATAPRVNAVSSVGSGDAALGGLAMALLRGRSLPEALAYGMAVGAANATTLGAGVFDVSMVEELMGRTEIKPL